MEQAGASRVTIIHAGDPKDLARGLGPYPKNVDLNVLANDVRDFEPKPETKMILFADGDLIMGKVDLPAFLEAAVGARPVLAVDSRDAVAKKSQQRESVEVVGDTVALSSNEGASVASVGLLAIPAERWSSSGPAASNFADLATSVAQRETIQAHEFRGFWHKMSSGARWGRVKSQLLNEQKKPVDIEGVLGLYLFRPISTKMSRFLAPLPVTPNHITALALILGWVAAGLMATGTAKGFLWAAIIMQFGAVIDCVDGELARVKDMGSRFGGWFDTVVDDIVNQSFLMGTAIGVWRQDDVTWPLVVGITSFALVLPALIFMYRELIRVGETDICMFPWTEPEGASDRAPNPIMKALGLLEYVVKRDFYLSAFVVLILTGQAWLVPICGLLGTVGVGIMLLRELALRRKARRKQR